MLTRRRLLNGMATGGALGLGALAALPSARAASSTLFGASRLRNIHLILEESFWDPAPLTAANVEQPIDPRFMKLWAESGHTHALSPAFAGQTANAEFEILTGFPLDRVSVKFEEGFNDHLPALPKILSDIGYRTVASHPNSPGFWNRLVSYQKLGFETFWSLNDFTQDDMAGPFLSDKSLHAQVGEMLAGADDGRPVFDYTVTFYGHWAYDASAFRPQVIGTKSKIDEVSAYINTVHYKSQEMMDALAHIQASDPDSIIILFGDHLPILGRQFAGYAESGFLAPTFGKFTADMYARSTATPLVVIDGKKGPLKLGNVPMYRLGRIILDLIAYDQPSMLDLALPPAQALKDTILRPLPGVVVSYRPDGLEQARVSLPDKPGEEDAEVIAWLKDVKLIATDIFDGRKYALRGLSA
jgi:phosphoglycerol transferase MdoB-like AlkP superfamily enzyme